MITLRERNLTLVEDFKDGKLESTFRLHEENKLWQCMEKKNCS